MVNPYLQPRSYGGTPSATKSAKNQPKIGSLGSSQILQKLENLGKKKQSKKDKKSSKQSNEFKSEKAKLFETTSESESEETSELTDPITTKRLMNNKFIKKPEPKQIEYVESNEEEVTSEETEKSEMTIQSFRSESQSQSDNENDIVTERQPLGTGRSSASKLHTASSSSIGRRIPSKVTFEKQPKDEESQIVSIIDSQASDTESTRSNLNRNIYDINELEQIKPNRKSKKAKSSDDESSFKNNFILDLDTLENQRSDTKKRTNLKVTNEKWASEQKNSSSTRRAALSYKNRASRTQSIVSVISEDRDTIVTEIQTEKSDSVDSFASEIKEDSITFRPQSRSSVSAHYADDFDTELETATSRSRVRTPLKFKRLENNLIEPERRSMQTQVDDMDLVKNSPAFSQNLNVYSPFSLGPLMQLQNLDNIVQYNVINHTFNDIIKMNLDFMKNFLSVQRQLYENEIKSIKPKKYSF